MASAIASSNKSSSVNNGVKATDSSEFTSTPDVRSYDDFQAMPGITEEIWKGICGYGIHKPSPIQAKAVVPIASKRDVIVQGHSGSGKTICFSLGTLCQLETTLNKTQCIIVSPTRELALQTRNVIAALGDHMSISTHSCIGESNYSEDIQKCQLGSQVISGSPGRLLDMLSKGYIDVTSLQSFILDEADMLLDSGFTEDIYEIYRRLPPNTQTVCVSATFPRDVLEMTTKFMTNPIKVLKMRDEISSDSIKNYFINLLQEDFKIDTLCDMFDLIEGISQSIIYCNSIVRAEWLKQQMVERNFDVAMTHGELHQKEREQLLRDFRQGRVRTLISTDLMSRGVDIQNVALVINYDVPRSRETYVHRVGRAGRFGKRGVAINLVTPRDIGRIKDIEQYYNIVIDEMPNNIQDAFQ